MKYLIPVLALALMASCTKNSAPGTAAPTKVTCNSSPFFYGDGTASVGVPTAFSPNSDGINDYIGISESDGIDTIKYSLTIITEMKATVYKSNSVLNLWNGTDSAGRMLPEGQYAAKLHFKVGQGQYMDTTCCVYLFRSDSAGYLPGAARGYIFQDQLNKVDRSVYPQSSEKIRN